MSNPDSEPIGTLRLAGRVVGPDGRGVAGADVWIDSVPQRTATSGSDGAFEFANLISRSYQIRAKADELIGGPQMHRPIAQGAPVLISLREGAHILVTAVDAASVPIANAEVRIVGEDAVSVTDEKGVAKVTAHPGWVNLEAVALSYAPRLISVPLGSFGSRARVTIVLHKGFPVSGRVLDEDRKPISNARVYARQTSGIGLTDEHKESAVTDENGSFTIPSAVGMHSFVVIDDEHAPVVTPTFDVDRAITELEIIMKRGAVYSGSVVDADGKPVARARIHCDSMGPLGQRRNSGTTDANGAFEIRGLPRTMVMAYATSEKGVSDEAMVQLMNEPELRDQKLVLNAVEGANGVISGTVVDDTGAPVPDVIVNAALRRRSGNAMHSGGVDTSIATSTRTDSHGQFSIADLLPGEYGMWPGAFEPQPLPVEAAQYVPGRERTWFMTIAKSGDKSVRVVMPRAGVIKGKLAFADNGEPVKEFTVDPQPSHDSDFGTSGAQGAFELRDLRPGTFALRITGKGFLDASKADVRVEAGKTTDIGTITVQRGRMLRGKVVDSAGRPVAGAKVMLGFGGVYGSLGKFDDDYTDHLGAVTDATGAFSITGVQSKLLVASPVMALVAGADHPSYGRSLPVSIPAGAQDPSPITLALRDCGSIAGKVTQNGKPIAAMIGAGWPEFGMAETNEDGAFVVSRVPVGPVMLRIRPSTELSRAHQTTVQVEAGKQTDVAIDIPVGTIKLAVTVKAKPGHALSGAKLFLFIGTVAFDNYAQLSWRLFADGQGFASWEGDANRPAMFERIVPGDYTVCTMPLAWSPSDEKLMKRVHRGVRESVKVYCTPVRVLPAVAEQTLTVEVPSMAPLP